MGTLHSHNIFPSLYLLLLQFSSLALLSSAYTLPEKYFINCGSDSNLTVNGRNFIGDEKSDFFAFSSGQSSTLTNTNSTKNTSPIYQTARIFTKLSSYELEIAQNGTYMVRFHFFVFLSLSSAQFNVSASGFSLLSNFSLENTNGSVEIKEFLLIINVRKFVIYFSPSQESSFAFVNAIEVFLASDSFPDGASHISPSGSEGTYSGLPGQVLHTVYRINVGGLTLTPENNTLWRNWVSDDEYLFLWDSAKNSEYYNDMPSYQRGGATKYSAPDLVYLTAKELNIDPHRTTNFFNITWRLSVHKNASHLVRVHFCDIISVSLGVSSIFMFMGITVRL